MGSQAPYRPIDLDKMRPASPPPPPPPPPRPQRIAEQISIGGEITNGTRGGVAKSDNAVTTTINGCARCGGNHESLAFRQFVRGPIKTATGFATHWATCPTFGEPILMRIEQTDD